MNYNIIHGDIKPENILINPKTYEIKIIDFDSTLKNGQMSNKYVGTEYYQAPEMMIEG